VANLEDRNQKVFNNVDFDPLLVSQKVSALVEEFSIANLPLKRSQVHVVPRWQPPPFGSIKVNVDAGCFEDGSTGWGFIARNAAGLALSAETKSDGISYSPLMAECLGVRWCLAWVLEKQLSNVIIETDAEKVVKRLYGDCVLAEIEPIILDCLEYLSKLVNVSVCSISRDCNKVAHSLGQLSKAVGCKSWNGCIPNSCLSVYCNDLPYV
jgi:hypothetical protein